MGPFWAAVYMPHAAQKGPLRGHDKGWITPILHGIDAMISSHRCMKKTACKSALYRPNGMPLGCAVHMPHAAQKGPLRGHDKGWISPVFAWHRCDDIIALSYEKNRMQIGLVYRPNGMPPGCAVHMPHAAHTANTPLIEMGQGGELWIEGTYGDAQGCIREPGG